MIPDNPQEAIAQWLETLHCSQWKDIGCIKTNCLLFRDLAERIRSGEWKGEGNAKPTE